MKTATLTFLLLTGVFPSAFCDTFGVNIYVSEKMTWSEARAYCRKHYTDLTSTDSQEESEELLMLENEDAGASTTNNISAVNSNSGWIGLHKDVNGTWRWSGGKNTLFPLWISLQELLIDHSCVIQSERGWQMINCEEKFPFYCFQSSLVLVKEKKSWEEALEHCRSLRKQLVSLSSESALNKVLQTSRTALTAQVWTGLHYLGDSWLWVDGTCMGYQTWCREGMLQCPASSHHCGVLSLERQQLDSWDCAAKLNFICY